MAEIFLRKGRVICYKNLQEVRQKGTQSTLKIQQISRMLIGMEANQYHHITVSCILQDFWGQTDKASDETCSGQGTRKINLQKVKHSKASMTAW